MLVISLLLLPILLFLAYEKPVIFYMICFTIMSNIGGYFNAIYIYERITLQDIAYISGFMIIFSNKLKWGQVVRDKTFINFFFFLLGLHVYVIIFPLIIYSGNDIEFSLYTILNWRWLFFGFLSIIPGYLIAQNSKLILQAILMIGFLVVFLFLLSLFTKVPFMPVYQGSRDIESVDVPRIAQMGHLSFQLLIIWIGLLVMVKKFKISYKIIIILTAVFLFIFQILSLGRGINLFLFGSLFATIYYIKKYFNEKVNGVLKYLIIFTSLLILLVFLIFPGYLNAYYQTFYNSLLELTGKIPEGTTQSRTTFELVNQMPLIKSKPLFGIGISEIWIKNETFSGNISDLPLITIIAMFGIFGTMFYFYSYFLIFRRMDKFYKQTKGYFKNFVKTNKHDVLLLLSLFIYFFSMAYFRLFNTGVEFIADYSKIEFYIFIGLMFGLMNKLEKQVKGINSSDVIKFPQ